MINNVGAKYNETLTEQVNPAFDNNEHVMLITGKFSRIRVAL